MPAMHDRRFRNQDVSGLALSSTLMLSPAWSACDPTCHLTAKFFRRAYEILNMDFKNPMLVGCMLTGTLRVLVTKRRTGKAENGLWLQCARSST